MRCPCLGESTYKGLRKWKEQHFRGEKVHVRGTSRATKVLVARGCDRPGMGSEGAREGNQQKQGDRTSSRGRVEGECRTTSRLIGLGAA